MAFQKNSRQKGRGRGRSPGFSACYCFLAVCLAGVFVAGPAFGGGRSANPSPAKKRQTMTPGDKYNDDEYLDFFEEVYDTMRENYYHEVTREDYQRFLTMFRTRIYSQLTDTGKTSDYVKWRSAAYMVEFLRAPDDIFSAFFPPKAAKTYENTVLGKRIDLGITGSLEPEGYLVTQIEPRSDAFLKGLKKGDVVLSIDGADVLALSKEQISERLNPLEKSIVRLDYIDRAAGKEKSIDVESREYFKQTVFLAPTPVPGVYCVKIERFNRKTSEDLTRYMGYVLGRGDTSLIIDLRGNPGGPPLAAREISAFFLKPEEEFAYFQMRGRPKSSLFVPKIPERFHYKGDIVILVNEKSGSASELFSGVLQGLDRAEVMGVNSAGQVFLKSMFYFDDGSMVLLVTARGHRPDGTVFPFSGIEPDVKVDVKGDSLINYAALYLEKKRQSGHAGQK